MNLKKYFTNIYPILFYILKIHILALLFLSMARGILLLTNLQNVETVKPAYIQGAFSLGFFIDNIAVSAVSVIAILVAIVISFFDVKNIIRKCFNVCYIVIYAAILGISVADIPYFNYFYRHVDIGVLDWFKHDTAGFSMILTEPAYYKYILVFLLFIIVFSLCVVLFSKQWKNYGLHQLKSKKVEAVKLVVVGVLLGVVSYMGITKKHHDMQPIVVWSTYLSPSSFANELTTSPIYNTLVSITVPRYKDVEVNHIISVEDSFDLLKKDFIAEEYMEDISPICRKVTSDKPELRANVVIVLMESMSMYYLDETPHLTPFLNELKGKSYFFRNFYSPGTHTNQGIFATLYGIPALFDKVIMDDRVMSGSGHLPLCEGLPYNLNARGYTSYMFVSHDKDYNNMDMFLYKNGYDLKNVFAKENYPASEYVNYWGVSDAYLFKYATEIFSKKKDAPFFGTIMTITNHPEYVVPEEFTSISSDPSEQTVYYSDYCIRKFLEDASKQGWYENTIFLFLGDHGKILGKQEYEIPLALNHIPLMIYSPLFEDMPETFDCYGSQIDIFPTVMGLLNMEYENNSPGIDLLKEKRPYAVFTTDEKLGCIDGQYLYSYNTLSKLETLYDYKNSNMNVSSAHQNAFDSIRNYAAATVQATNYMLKNRLTRREGSTAKE